MSFDKGLWLTVLGICVLGVAAILVMGYAHPADLLRADPEPLDRAEVSREFEAWMTERHAGSWPELDLGAAGREPGVAWERVRDQEEVQWYYEGLERKY